MSGFSVNSDFFDAVFFVVDVQIEERHGPVVFFFVREFYVSSVVHSVDIVCIRLLFFPRYRIFSTVWVYSVWMLCRWFLIPGPP